MATYNIFLLTQSPPYTPARTVPFRLFESLWCTGEYGRRRAMKIFHKMRQKCAIPKIFHRNLCRIPNIFYGDLCRIPKIFHLFRHILHPLQHRQLLESIELNRIFTKKRCLLCIG